MRFVLRSMIPVTGAACINQPRAAILPCRQRLQLLPRLHAGTPWWWLAADVPLEEYVMARPHIHTLALTSHEGKKVTAADLRGKHALLFFGTLKSSDANAVNDVARWGRGPLLRHPPQHAPEAAMNLSPLPLPASPQGGQGGGTAHRHGADAGLHHAGRHPGHRA